MSGTPIAVVLGKTYHRKKQFHVFPSDLAKYLQYLGSH